MPVKKITRRWLFNSFGVIVFIIVAIEIVAAVGISSYYYNSVRQTLLSRAESVNTIFKQYADDPNATDFTALVRAYVSEFPARDRMELMTVNARGEVDLTSSGFEPLPEDKSNLRDYLDALQTSESGRYVGWINGQKVMAVSVLSPVEGHDSLSAVRFMTGLVNVDKQIRVIIAGMIVLGLFILVIVLFSSSYFISSIVNPVGLVGETARKIAQGDFTARLENKTDDEIGELCDIINHMASELGAAEQIKNEFISSVSHELRTPLTAIQGWAETLLSDGGADKDILGKGMGVIISETSRLSQMVEELLDFSRMQSGQLRLIFDKTDALAELSEAYLMYTERAKREGIALVYEENDSIATVNGDKNKLRQVFVNIIDNAIKYSDAGGTVTITTRLTPATVHIDVTDSGIGIREEDLAQIKKKFYKVDTTRRGSGIGLAVADEIVTRHGGTLELSSVYGEGTTVSLVLPLLGNRN